jgi:hypothetical protein
MPVRFAKWSAAGLRTAVRGIRAQTDALKSGLLTRGALRSWTITSWVRVRFSCVRLMPDLVPAAPWPVGARFSPVRSVRSCSCSSLFCSDGRFVGSSRGVDPSCGSLRESAYRRAVPGRSYGFAHSAAVLEAARSCGAPAPGCVPTRRSCWPCLGACPVVSERPGFCGSATRPFGAWLWAAGAFCGAALSAGANAPVEGDVPC